MPKKDGRTVLAEIRSDSELLPYSGRRAHRTQPRTAAFFKRRKPQGRKLSHEAGRSRALSRHREIRSRKFILSDLVILPT